MTDFRHVRGLHAYSGGTVPDLHRISLFSVEPKRISTALKCLLNSGFRILFFYTFVKGGAIVKQCIDNASTSIYNFKHHLCI